MNRELSEEIVDEILRYALKNAVEHNGRARPGPVINKVIGKHPELRESRELMRVIGRKVAEIVEEVNKLSVEEQRRLLRERWPEELERRPEVRQELPPLPDAVEGKVVTRFAPNPDFLIHLGNARPAILSYEYARMYKGRMILRFEDTDPKTKTPLPEAYKLIREDLRWLGIKWSEEYIQSLRMNIYYTVAKELISRGGAYVDLCSQKEFQRYKLMRRPCPHRELSVEDNLELFDKMISGHFSEGEAVLRVKTDITHKDPSVIDWVAFRVLDTDRYPHPITGSKYVAWPTYNFAAAVDDHLMGITHILRGKEHAVNTIKQGYLYQHMGWKYPRVINVGRLRLEDLILSKSMIKKLLSEHPDRFLGPNDIRFGLIASLRNRGIEPEAIRRIIMNVGVSPGDATISWDNIAAINRSLIDLRTKRLMAVFNPVQLIIKGYAGPNSIKLPYHPENEGLGFREVPVTAARGLARVYICRDDVKQLMDTDRKLVRLMGLCNIKLIAIEEDSKAVAEYVSSGVDEARRLGLKIIQWVPEDGWVKLSVAVPKGLNLRYEVGMAEPSIASAKVGERFQLIRYGFIKITKAGEKEVEAIFMHR